MGWYQMPDGTRRHAQPNTRRARELAALGASPCDTPTPDTEPDEPEATPGEEPIEVVLSQPAKDVVAHASTVDYERIEEMIRYETNGRNREQLIVQLHKMRDNAAADAAAAGVPGAGDEA